MGKPRSYEVEQRRLQRGYPNIVKFVKTDCKAGLGIDELIETIRRKLKEADIVILMLSNEFFGSTYIKGAELKEAIRRHEAGEAEVIPVLLAESPAFKRQPWLKKLQTVPNANGRPKALNKFNPRVNGWNKVQEALRTTIAEFAKTRRRQF